MSKKTYSILKFRRGNTAFIQSTTGAEGEMFVNLQTKEVYLQDGVKQGGYLIGGDPYATANTIYTQGVDATQNTIIQGAFDQANTGTILAQAAFDYANTILGSDTNIDQYARDTANTASNNILDIQGVNDTQNTNITYATDLAQASFDYANTILNLDTNIDQYARDTANSATSNTIYTQGVDDTQNTYIQSAFDQANTATNDAASASEYANTGINNAASASDYANTAIDNAASASEYANSGTVLAQASYDQANTNSGDITIIQGVDDTQNTNIENVNNLAQSAFDYANTQLGNYSFSDDTITNNIDNDIILTTNGNEWNFGANGELTLPSGGHLGATKGGTMLDAGNGYDTSLTTFYANGNYASCVTGYAADGRLIITSYNDGGTEPSKQWTFNNTGELNVPGSIVPVANNEYSLGSPDFQWKSLYVSNNTIYIENIPLSLKSNGNTNIITVGSGANTTNIASENFVQSFQNIDGGSSTAIYSYELINIDGGGA